MTRDGDDAMRQHLAGRVSSNEWWTLITATPSIANGPLLEIARSLYDLSAPGDFEVAAVPWRLGRPITAVVCAHKRRLPPTELLHILARFIDLSASACRAIGTGGDDVLLLDDDASPASRTALWAAFWDFLIPGAALRVALRN
jgi:hypothetical protein